MADSSLIIKPFVGLRAFEENEDYLFFGRSAEINDLLKKFGSSPFLAVIGSSGSGKSSLVKSGLLPAIYSGYLSPGSNWRVAVLRPGDNPIGNLAQELAREGVLYKNTANAEIKYQPFVETTLRRSSGGLVQAYRQAHLPSTEKLLVVVDQFEELFRFNKDSRKSGSESDALNFVNLLLEAADEKKGECPIYVLITMRSDFLGDCARFAGLPEAINAGQYLVPRMTRDEIREAITGPVAVAGAQIAPRLVTRVLNDVGNNLDQLPILQHAMMRTWESWQKKNKPALPIDVEDYDNIGGMSGALDKHAEEAYAELTTKEQQRICELMFKALTDKAADVRGIRVPRKVEDLCTLTNATPDEVIQVVEVFRKTGRTFLMPLPGMPLTKATMIDISHESIMRVWQRLIKWIEEEAQGAEIYLRLSEEAKLYEEGKTDLWRNPQLAIGLNWYNTNKPNALWAERYNKNFEKAIAFLKKSEEAAQIILEAIKEKERVARNRRSVGIIILIFFAIIAGFAAITFNKLKNKAESSAKEAHIKDSLAQIDRAHAEQQEQIANAAYDKELRERNRADSLTLVAKAETEKAIALNRKIAAININLTAANAAILAKNKEIAASEYLRRIREGPTEEDSIKADSFNYKLVAYDYHLGKLGVKEKNDELYEKLYYCMKFGPDKKYVIDALPRPISDSISLAKNNIVYVSDDKLSLLLSKPGQAIDTLYSSKPGIGISVINADGAAKRIFIATEDNILTVFKYDDQYNLSLENKIPMGGLVTAIDYDNTADLILFGLKTGEIGYIKYANKKERKYQPVYRNQLDSKITAIDFFVRNRTRYLLATSIRGKAVVYESASTDDAIINFLNPNKPLTEIALPENFGDIKKAKYDSLSNRIVFVTTSRRTYSWNPFVNELLGQLEKGLDPQYANLDSIKSHTKLY